MANWEEFVSISNGFSKFGNRTHGAEHNACFILSKWHWASTSHWNLAWLDNHRAHRTYNICTTWSGGRLNKSSGLLVTPFLYLITMWNFWMYVSHFKWCSSWIVLREFKKMRGWWCSSWIGAPLFCPKWILDIGLKFVQRWISFPSPETYVPVKIQARYGHDEDALLNTFSKSIFH